MLLLTLVLGHGKAVGGIWRWGNIKVLGWCISDVGFNYLGWTFGNHVYWHCCREVFLVSLVSRSWSFIPWKLSRQSEILTCFNVDLLFLRWCWISCWRWSVVSNLSHSNLLFRRNFLNWCVWCQSVCIACLEIFIIFVLTNIVSLFVWVIVPLLGLRQRYMLI